MIVERMSRGYVGAARSLSLIGGASTFQGPYPSRRTDLIRSEPREQRTPREPVILDDRVRRSPKSGHLSSADPHTAALDRNHSLVPTVPTVSIILMIRNEFSKTTVANCPRGSRCRRGIRVRRVVTCEYMRCKAVKERMTSVNQPSRIRSRRREIGGARDFACEKRLRRSRCAERNDRPVVNI